MTTPSAADNGVRADAQRWFARLLAPDCGVEERAAFERWRGADPAHEAAYREVETVWERSAGMREDPAIAAAVREALRPATRAERRSRHPGWWPALAAAALVVLAVAVSWRLLRQEDVPPVRYATALGEQRTVALEDGSQVVLDTRTELLAQFGRRERSLTLRRGQAEFKVQRDPERPFVVHAAGGSVTATGTQFQVRVTDGGSAVTLLEGQVVVAGGSGGHRQSATLAPNQRIVIEPDGRLGGPRAMPEAELAGIRGWTEGNLVVKEWPLEAVVAEMNRYSDTKLRLGDPALGGVPISGVFKAGDQQSFAMALEYGWSFRIDPRPAAGEIVVRRH